MSHELLTLLTELVFLTEEITSEHGESEFCKKVKDCDLNFRLFIAKQQAQMERAAKEPLPRETMFQLLLEARFALYWVENCSFYDQTNALPFSYYFMSELATYCCSVMGFWENQLEKPPEKLHPPAVSYFNITLDQLERSIQNAEANADSISNFQEFMDYLLAQKEPILSDEVEIEVELC